MNLLNEASATSYPSQLNALAQSLHDAINTQHALGSTSAARPAACSSTSPRRPARPAPRLACACRPAILADPTTIAAGATGQGPGSATNANAMVALQNAITTGGTTFHDYYNGHPSGLGTAAAEHGPLGRRAADRGQRPLGSAAGQPRASRSTRR